MGGVCVCVCVCVSPHTYICVLKTRGYHRHCQCPTLIAWNPFAIFLHISSGCFHSQQPELCLFVKDSSQAAGAHFVHMHRKLKCLGIYFPRGSPMTDSCGFTSAPAPFPLIKVTLMCTLLCFHKSLVAWSPSYSP